jgi:hypothetical protein
MYVTHIHKFSYEFCNSILLQLDECPKIYLSLDDSVSESQTKTIYRNQPSNADAWDINLLPQIDELKALLHNSIPNITEFEFEVLRLDNTKTSKEHMDSWDYTAILLLNDKFDGGRLMVESVDSNLSLGDIVYFPGINKHYVSPIQNGERFTLVCFMKTKIKTEKTLI